MPREIHLNAPVDRVPLIVIEKESSGRRREIGKAAVDAAESLRVLVRIRDVSFSTMEQARRSQRRFRSPDAGGAYGERKENIRIPDDVVVEKVSRMRVELIDIQRPSAEGDRHTKLIFFIALAMQRNDSKTLIKYEVE